jgi:hypothetical protein
MWPPYRLIAKSFSSEIVLCNAHILVHHFEYVYEMA